MYSVSIVAAFKGDDQKWMLIGVYGPTTGARFDEFIVELQLIRTRTPWCIGGDFNEVLYLEERSHAEHRTLGMELFYEFVD